MAGNRKRARTLMKRVLAIVGVLVLAFLTAGVTRAAVKPLSQDDVTLLLLGGATTEKMLPMMRVELMMRMVKAILAVAAM